MKSIFGKNLLLVFLFLLVAIFFSGCAGMLTTRTLSDVNHYQDGRTIGKDKSAIGISFGMGETIKTDATPTYIGKISLSNTITANFFFKELYPPMLIFLQMLACQ